MTRRASIVITLVLAACELPPTSTAIPPVDTDAGAGHYQEVFPLGCEHHAHYDARLAPFQSGGTACGKDSAPTHVHLTFPADPSTTIAFTWQTDRGTLPTDVELGPVPERLAPAARGVTFWMQPPGTDEGRRIHEAHVCGLSPATTYFYRVGGPCGWSPVRSFRTAPRPGSGDLVTFAVVGDCRNNHDIWGQVAEAVEAADPDFVVFTGDAVNRGAELSDWDGFFEYAESLLASVPFVPANGNHEANELPFYAQFGLPGNEQWFELRYANLDFVVLNDSPPPGTPDAIAGVERDFLEDALAATPAPWRFTVHHKPPYSSASFHGPTQAMWDTWVPVLDAHDVAIALAGHEHVYERTQQMRGGQPVPTVPGGCLDPANGTVYTINGGAGANLYGVGTGEPWTNVIESVHSFTLVTVQGDRLDWLAYRQDDDDPHRFDPLDHFCLQR